jgi:6-phosphogluconolactonase (cycloisomerase 2 family)
VVDISISNSIFVYQAVSGVLTEMTSSTLALSNTVFDMVMSPDGQYLYAALLYGQGVVALGHSSGVLTELVTYPATARTQYMAMSPDGRFLYVSKDAYFNQAANLGQVTVYGVQAGVLSEIAGSPFNVSGYPKGLAVSPDGSWVAIANPANKSTDLYQSNQGSLSFVQSISSTTPSASTRAAQFIAFSPNGQYLFTSASNGATNTGALLADSVPSTPSNTLSALVNMQAAPSGTASSIYSMAPSPLVFAPIPASAPATLSLP